MLTSAARVVVAFRSEEFFQAAGLYKVVAADDHFLCFPSVSPHVTQER